MKSVYTLREQIDNNGFVIAENIFTIEEINSIILAISSANQEKPTFRKTSDLFAIRQFLKELPETRELIFTKNLISLISDLFGAGYFVVKSIYFDKPGQSNWFVAYHQDLTISIDKKTDIEGFSSWTVKQDQFAVQPPVHILENNFTLRIHLDDTDENNGALKVIPSSHLNGVHKLEVKPKNEVACKVKKGGIMIMRPLLFHASDKTTNGEKRRVIHIEFSKSALPSPLEWSERIDLA